LSTGPKQSALGERYAAHNRARGRGFIYGGSERTAALRAFLSIPRDGLVLDLGCRDGSLATALGLPPERTVGADIDPEALSASRAGAVSKPCRVDLWGGFPFRDGAFSLAVAGEIVEHVPFPEEFIAETARVLRVQGRVVGSVPNAFRLRNRLLFATGRWFEADPTHLRQFSPGSLRTLLERHFADVRIRPCVGRLNGLWPRMFGNDLVWTGVKREA
jgi:SAM-dependent methyltransferase